MPFDKSKYLVQFKNEAREHIQKLSSGLLKLEKSPQDKELLDLLMREAHTIKGTSTMMGYKRIADIAHTMEDGLEKALKGELIVGKAHFDVMLKCLDSMDPLLEDKLTWEDKGIERPFVEQLCHEVNDIFSGKFTVQTPRQVIVDNQVTKPEFSRPEPDQVPKPEKKTVQPMIYEEESIRVDVSKLDTLVELSGELLTSKIRLVELSKSLAQKARASVFEPEVSETIEDLKAAAQRIDSISSGIQKGVMNVRMIPISFLFNQFPRMIRDLSYDSKKEVELVIKGETTHLDKTLINEMHDPLVHILRNAIDHGIENPQEREAAGKPKTGTITLNAFQKGSQVVIEISDDGRGIDIEKVKQKAVSRGLYAEAVVKSFSEEQVYQILFAPGFSTKDEVTEISGRGVGLDVVKEKVAQLKGVIVVSSKPGRGTVFSIKLPLTLAITDSLLVNAGNEVFAIPINAVVETIRVSSKDIHSIENKEAVSVRGTIVPIIHLKDFFALEEKGIIEKRFFSVVVVQSVEKKIGILVDKILGHQEIVIKPLGDPLNNVTNIAGGTITGSGKVVLIIDVPSIIDSAGTSGAAPSLQRAKTVRTVRKKTILLAEDTVSTATLEKNILEGVGFSVVLAKDGKEAYEKALKDKYDLIISDVLMPRMNGFELTQSIKTNKSLKNTPVIIVTTRESDADKRRGLEAGADAYILKSEFTTEGLLETITRLIG